MGYKPLSILDDFWRLQKVAKICTTLQTSSKNILNLKSERSHSSASIRTPAEATQKAWVPVAKKHALKVYVLKGSADSFGIKISFGALFAPPPARKGWFW